MLLFAKNHINHNNSFNLFNRKAISFNIKLLGELIFMRVNLFYAIFTCLLIGVLGGLVFFVWDLINNSFSISHATIAAINAGIIFGILGFILGLIISGMK